jgi:hypothetical protein
MSRFLRAYFAIYLKWRWVVSLIPMLVIQGFQYWQHWLAPLPSNINSVGIWSPPPWSWAFSIATGFGLVGTIAWYDQFRKNKALTEGFPKIALADQPIEVAPFAVLLLAPRVEGPRFPIANYTALRLRVRNNPLVNTERASTRVNARVSFFDDSGGRLVVMDGRWADSTQMAERDVQQDYVESQAVPFPVGSERSLDLMFKRPGEQDCIALNNDNFTGGSPDLGMQGRTLNGVVLVKVELNGTYVKTTITF